MARPRKKGLSYFPKDVDFYNDMKIFKLCEKHGPRGVMIYEVALTCVYREGYYLECTVEDLAFIIMRTIGTKWIRSSELVCEVIYCCAEIGLFDKHLLNQGIVTSRGIQLRYSEATVRNKVDTSKYWLLDGDFENKIAEPLLNAPENTVSVTKTSVSVTKTPVSVTEMQQRKVNKSKVNEIKREYAPRVFLTETEYTDLVKQYGELQTERMIEILDNYKQSKNVKYDSDFAALKSWVVDAYEERAAKRKMIQSKEENHSYNLEKFEKLAIGNTEDNKE